MGKGKRREVREMGEEMRGRGGEETRKEKDKRSSTYEWK